MEVEEIIYPNPDLQHPLDAANQDWDSRSDDENIGAKRRLKQPEESIV